MATYSELRGKVLRLLGDPDGEGYSDDALLDAIGAAFDAVLPWVPKTRTSTITADSVSTLFTLPTDLYEIEAVVNTDSGEVLPRAMFSPGLLIGAKSANVNDWIEYPHGSISFSKAPTVDHTLYYLAYWTKPTLTTSQTETLELPQQCLTGATLYAAAYALYPAAIGASEIGQFKTKIDSGTPEHNPLQKTALYLLDLFQKEMSRHPKHQKASK